MGYSMNQRCAKRGNKLNFELVFAQALKLVNLNGVENNNYQMQPKKISVSWINPKTNLL